MTAKTIRDLIRAELSGGKSLNIPDVSARVMAQVTDYRAALDTALPHLVREMIGETRIVSPAQPTPQNRSAKVSAIREQHKRRLADGIWPDANGTMKRLGSFNYDDLIVMADRLNTAAKRNLAREKVIRDLAQRMADTGANVVDDLDDAETLLAGAA